MINGQIKEVEAWQGQDNIWRKRVAVFHVLNSQRERRP